MKSYENKSNGDHWELAYDLVLISEFGKGVALGKQKQIKGCRPGPNLNLVLISLVSLIQGLFFLNWLHLQSSSVEFKAW